MTELRDARLQRALQAADDEAASPREGTRESVMRAAREAMAAPTPLRRRWWDIPHYRMSLTAAFASIVMATVILLLWSGQEIPDARPEQSAVADRQAPAPAALPAPAPAPAPAIAPAPATAPVLPAPKPPTPGPLADRTQPPESMRAPDALAKKSEEARAEREAAAAARQRQDAQREESSRVAQRPPAAVAESAPQVAAAPQAAAPQSAPAAPAPAAAAPAAAPQAPVARMQAAPAPAPPGAGTQASLSRRASWEDWSEARVEAQGRAATVARGRGFRLAELLYGVVNSRADAPPIDDPATTRITLSRLGITVGVLELGARQAQWAPVDGPVRTVQPEPEALRQLQQEAQRLANN